MAACRVAVSQRWSRDHPGLLGLPCAVFPLLSFVVHRPPPVSPSPSFCMCFLLTPFVLCLSLSYSYVIHRLARKELHAGVDAARLSTAVRIYLLLLDHAGFVRVQRKNIGLHDVRNVYSRSSLVCDRSLPFSLHPRSFRRSRQINSYFDKLRFVIARASIGFLHRKEWWLSSKLDLNETWNSTLRLGIIGNKDFCYSVLIAVIIHSLSLF